MTKLDWSAVTTLVPGRAASARCPLFIRGMVAILTLNTLVGNSSRCCALDLCYDVTTLLVVDGNLKYSNYVWDVAISDNSLFVIDSHDESNGPLAGAVLLYEQVDSTWQMNGKITPSDGRASQQFGTALAYDKSRLAVGSGFQSESQVLSGAAYLFENGDEGWVEIQKLEPPTALFSGFYGISVDLEGDLLVVGMPGNYLYTSTTGHAYVYRWLGTSWELEADLTGSTSANDDEFGFAVGINSEVIVVGARRHDAHGIDAGAGYVFLFDGQSWVEEDVLLPPHDSDYAGLGSTLDIEGSLVLLGARGENESKGVVHAFANNDGYWNEVPSLAVIDGAPGDSFGSSLDLHGDFLLVGASGVDEPMPGAGAAYLFHLEGDNWVQAARFVAPTPSENLLFGFSSALDAVGPGRALVGAKFVQDPGGGQSAAYVFEGIAYLDCNANLIHDYCEVVEETESDKDQDGVLDSCGLPTCAGDANLDGMVDPLDVGYVLSRFGCQVGSEDPECDAADSNKDGSVDPLDSGFVLARLGACE